jgi:hypothetical protein
MMPPRPSLAELRTGGKMWGAKPAVAQSAQ